MSNLPEDSLLAARQLERTYVIGKSSIPVLRGVNLEIQRGEVLFLCGASGAGKTTLLYALAGLERPDAGGVYIEGHPLYQYPVKIQSRIRNEMMGYVFQNYYLLPEFTALENAMMPALIGGSASREKAEQALVQVGLSDRLNHLPAEMSGGEQQRVAIARALINDPEILFADEPTGNLDSFTGQAVINQLLDIVRSTGKTLIVVTHDTNLASLGDRLLFLSDGLIVEDRQAMLL